MITRQAFLARGAAVFAALSTLLFADTATVDFNTVYQRIDGFGASSAYSGTVWTDDQADLLFSPEKGLGLSLLRVKITSDAASGTGTKMTTSNAETAIALKAIARGARVWGAPWSPPPQFKSNGNTVGSQGSFLSSGNQAYADMIADYAVAMKAAGVNLYAVSVQNEPDWSPSSYEGCLFSAQQMHDYVPFLYNSLLAKGAGTTRILAPESLHWQGTTSLAYINALMNDPDTAAKIGIIADHNYDGTSESAGAAATPANLPHQGRALWETEVMTSDAFDPSIANGLYWGQRLHLFMTAAQANGWHTWWVLPYPDGNSGLLGLNWAMTKRAYVLGQFAKFVRPGFYRIDASTAGSALISAYKEPGTGKFAIVAINNTTAPITETFTLANFSSASVTPWQTSDTDSLASKSLIAVTGNAFTATLPSNTVTTFVGTDTTPALPLTSSRIVNLSIRSNAGTGAQTLIAGFVVSGGGKPLLIRGAGPVLKDFGVLQPITNPQLALFPQGAATALTTNAGWSTAANASAIKGTADAVGAFPFPTGSADAAIFATLSEGPYSAQITGINGTTGTALVELYDATVGNGGRLVNVSARSQVGTGGDILIAGFVIQGTEPKTVLIRGVGPTLSTYGVTGVLRDPKVQLIASDRVTVLAANIGWGSTNASLIAGASTNVGAFGLLSDSADSALIATLNPGVYTVQVSGASGDTGVALVEIYEIR
jgi:glucuronoarabinoxylan endo-1,4-beta-xylanase